MTKRGSRERRNGERGYVLLFLLLSVALLSIGFTVMIQRIEFEIRRDREEELIHRGVQYSRAVRKFIKGFGRYPNSIEELENTNNIRFLRKRYKDPITGKDFKILRLMDLPSSKPLMGTATVKSMVSPHSSSSTVLSDSGEGPGTSMTSVGSDQQISASDSESAAPATNQIQSHGPDTSPRVQQVSGELAPVPPPQNFSGGPMVGVSSLSKGTTIREFNRKSHYNEWQFVYDPSTDRGGLLVTPDQPALQKNVQVDGQNNASSLRASEGSSAQ